MEHLEYKNADQATEIEQLKKQVQELKKENSIQNNYATNPIYDNNQTS